ncbi:4-methylaminobutanoate oxidase (formaldehyde-forming) [Streptosporangium becharense]|uniref:4-methylaminobutanoate oxidase (Formaldehyde-forming) n=1 Tax=Streptosporangium becharense TaxID=1816182 RepID=A0A7W9MGU0_9ACTN|nr:FAD-dependent oxidoreductase [Streptosporangium becharense]MBB2909202.1 4-methylaminobutanoate oxidase (formaldehyde-forming) [Streptosporangium becharense]MBB5819779.1 4-methylaminobutanoate oxidase (formaldehyde-forming) [Streptosporangium becharense]
MELPSSARAVVIGGGVAGAGVAYHLARLGWNEVVLVEQHELTEGTTWHSAGFVGQLRSTVTQTKMIMYSAGLYPELAELTGLDPGWRGVGGLRLATTPERVEESLRLAGAAETYGLDLAVLSGAEAGQSLPLLHTDDVRAALWLPGDGWLDPALLGRALAAGARKLGVRIFTGARVTGLDVTNGAISGVRLVTAGEEWRVRSETVVVAAGAASGTVGRMAGVDIPVVPIKHQYVVTQPFDVSPSMPTVRDPDNIVYFREEGGGILVGGYIRNPEIWDTVTPLAEPRILFPADMPKFRESWNSAVRRVPALARTEIVKVVHGPEAFTPDGEFLLGETAVRGLWAAAGFCVHGLAAAGGVGKVMAEWITDGSPEYDVSGMDLRRFGGHARSASWARAKALDSYSKYYDIVYPGEERTAARPLRRSPAWVRHAELRAVFGEKAGWERVNWFESNAPDGAASDGLATPDGPAPDGAAPDGLATPDGPAPDGAAPDGLATLDAPARSDVVSSDAARFDAARSAPGAPAAAPGAAGYGVRPAGWAGRIWSPAVRRECLATRDTAGLFDQTSFAKLEVAGPGALAGLQRACAGRLDRPVGSVVYTQLLNGRGGIEADLTVTRLAEDRFRLVTGTASGVHDAAWLRGQGLDVRDVTSAHACYCLWGPRALDILGSVSGDDLTFGYLKAREISVGNVPVLAQRVTFVGEFGWELYCPSEYGLTLWDTLVEAGTPYGMRPAGYRAIDAMRLEKGYRVWGLDITPETTPHEAGLGFAVARDKDFLGRLALRDAGPPARLLFCLVLDDPRQVCLGGEPVRVGGRPASRVTSGGYGHRVDRSIAYAYLPADTVPGDRVEVGVTGVWTGAAVAAEPLYDPAGERVRRLPS